VERVVEVEVAASLERLQQLFMVCSRVVGGAQVDRSGGVLVGVVPAQVPGRRIRGGGRDIGQVRDAPQQHRAARHAAQLGEQGADATSILQQGDQLAARQGAR